MGTCLSENVIKDIMATILLVVQKYYCEKYYCNEEISKMVNMDLEKLNKYEKLLLNLIDWQLIITPQEYDIYIHCIDFIFSGDIKLTKVYLENQFSCK